MKIIGAGLQPPLISGTNIQSINNTTLLQSGDRQIVQGYHILLPPTSGQVYSNNINSGSGGTSALQVSNRIILSPFYPANSITSSSLSINVLTLASGSLARILVYSNGATNQPLVKILESPNLDCSTTGAKTWTTTYTFNAGTIYWVGLQVNATTPTMSSWVNTASLPLTSSSSGGNTNASYVTTSYSFGSAPALMNLSNLSFSTQNAQLLITSA